ncbi:dihydrofolate synthase/folylpolyglutamate synthase [Tumebacillus sp. BK434]|uniref:bifunctional folylpolyglutamate synthase/dihydrofolate synthase n=1 Tax=Tumebacillus sp. BK434 TaxID=2512169 RepID=UPI001052756F|nr:folylpolyglutamate synthase/dihydrofolate synthase family protein [Tumebacillus sp. BK434]TCP59682.1 dihydrofolate synthase/folylpolyglutamate synthase [Tumebacillus sp. BK434]
MSAIEWIHSFDRFDGKGGIKPGLERMVAMLDRLGRPHDRLRFVHVAGTNGKGSTCSYLASMLQAEGYKVGLYTSPYLIQFHDRMTVGGVNISDAELEVIASELRPVVEAVAATEAGRPTEFEVLSVLSILHYARQAVDVVVWETGLGGRLDSTNVVTPLLSLITNVGMDHQAILGETLEQIAAEKAGIIKPGVPVLTTAQGAALAVIAETADANRSELLQHGRDFSAERTAFGWDGQTFDWQGLGVQLNGLQIKLLGPHQICNASLAVAACLQLRELGIPVAEASIRQGLLDTVWAGRLEVVAKEPLTVLDGAHNPEGAAALGTALRELMSEQKAVLIVGVMADKAIPEVLAPLLPLASQVIVTRADMPRSASVDAMAEMIARLDPQLPVALTQTVEEAFNLAGERARGTGEAIVCTGSLYMISEARALFFH